jgi:hypothetical protein
LRSEDRVPRPAQAAHGPPERVGVATAVISLGAGLPRTPNLAHAALTRIDPTGKDPMQRAGRGTARGHMVSHTGARTQLGRNNGSNTLEGGSTTFKRPRPPSPSPPRVSTALTRIADGPPKPTALQQTTRPFEPTGRQRKKGRSPVRGSYDACPGRREREREVSGCGLSA